MTTEDALSSGKAEPGHSRPLRYGFAMRFTSTPRGARLARRLVSHRLDEWGFPYDCEVNETVTLIASELTANAVLHGRIPGHDFQLCLTARPGAVRIEVSDVNSGRQPVLCAPAPDAEAGRGLFLVARLADRWSVSARPDGKAGKMVWAEIAP